MTNVVSIGTWDKGRKSAHVVRETHVLKTATKEGKKVLSESGKLFAREFRKIMDSDQIAKREIAGEYSAEFDRLRQARVNASFYKYGPARKNFGEGRVDALATAQRCLDAFEKDHNLEHLLDAANYLMFRWMYPMPGDFFQATDSAGSVGTVGTPINMERGDY